MPYIGVSPFNGVRRKHTYTATASQTSFSGAGTEGATLSYTDSTFVDVFQNGVKLGEADYTATSGTAIVLAQGASLNDLVEVVVYDVFSVADTVSKSAGGTFDGNVTMAGTLGVTGVLTGTSLDISGNIDVDGTTNLDVVDIDGAVNMATTLLVTGNVDFNGDLDVDGITNLDVVDIDGAVDMASTLQVDGAFTSSSTIAATRAGADQNILGEATTAGYASRLQLKAANYSGGSYNGIQSFQGDAGAAWEISGAKANATNVMLLSTGGAESMRISSGKVSIGTTTGTAKVSVYHAGNTLNLMRLQNTDGGNSCTMIQFANSADASCGLISQTGATTVAYTTSSDYRLKENVSYSFDATTRLKTLKPCRFNFIQDGTDKVVDGFLAHEVQEIVPEAIVGEKDAMIAEVLYVDGDDIPDGKEVGDIKTVSQINPQGIDQSKLVPLLVKTIQELEARIAALESA
jgi:cytoskeletal protein CcmA (bactofilin family)